MKRTALGLALLALLAFSGASSAAGTITGVQVSPSNGPLPFTMTATVNGTGQCDSFHISFGDGSPVLLVVHAFPATINPHTYATKGTYTVTVSPGNACSGQAAATIGAGMILGPPAMAPAGITAVKITKPVPPAHAKVGTDVRVTVEGWGNCEFFLGWGDNQFPADPYKHDLPMAGMGHTYNKAGKFEIKAWAQPPSTCVGSRSATIQVDWPFIVHFPNIDKICQLMPCGLPLKPGEAQEKVVREALALNDEFPRATPSRRKQIEQEAEKLLVQAQGMRR